nr:LysM peptidoglycan-binding domain-containing protein [Thermomonas brevis]
MVLEGDTLQSIAQRVYGNGSLWYVLAAANAVTDAELVAGSTLKVPSVKTTANDATTFKPFDPNVDDHAMLVHSGITTRGDSGVGNHPSSRCQWGTLIHSGALGMRADLDAALQKTVDRSTASPENARLTTCPGGGIGRRTSFRY